MLRLLLSIVFLSLVSQASASCDCIWRGPFLLAHKDVPDVLYGEVVKVNGNAFDLKVGEVLAGSEWRDTVRVWTKTKDLCRPSIDLFEQGSEWVVALHKISELPEDAFNPETPSISYGRKHDYYLSSCGAYWLSVDQKQQVSGNLSSMTQWEWQPVMTPIALSSLQSYFKGETTETELMLQSKEASGPESLKELTRQHLRNTDQTE